MVNNFFAPLVTPHPLVWWNFGACGKIVGTLSPPPMYCKKFAKASYEKYISYGQADRKEGGWGWGVSALLVLTLTKCEVFYEIFH